MVVNARPVGDDSDSDRSRGVVARRPPTTGYSGGKSAFRGGFGGETTGYFRRFVDFTEQIAINTKTSEQLIRPAAVRNVKQLHSARVRDLGREHAAELVAYVVLRQQYVTGSARRFPARFS